MQDSTNSNPLPTSPLGDQPTPLRTPRVKPKTLTVFLIIIIVATAISVTGILLNRSKPADPSPVANDKYTYVPKGTAKTLYVYRPSNTTVSTSTTSAILAAYGPSNPYLPPCYESYSHYATASGAVHGSGSGITDDLSDVPIGTSVVATFGCNSENCVAHDTLGTDIATDNFVLIDDPNPANTYEHNYYVFDIKAERAMLVQLSDIEDGHILHLVADSVKAYGIIFSNRYYSFDHERFADIDYEQAEVHIHEQQPAIKNDKLLFYRFGEDGLVENVYNFSDDTQHPMPVGFVDPTKDSFVVIAEDKGLTAYNSKLDPIPEAKFRTDLPKYYNRLYTVNGRLNLVLQTSKQTFAVFSQDGMLFPSDKYQEIYGINGDYALALDNTDSTNLIRTSGNAPEVVARFTIAEQFNPDDVNFGFSADADRYTKIIIRFKSANNMGIVVYSIDPVSYEIERVTTAGHSCELSPVRNLL